MVFSNSYLSALFDGSSDIDMAETILCIELKKANQRIKRVPFKSIPFEGCIDEWTDFDIDHVKDYDKPLRKKKLFNKETYARGYRHIYNMDVFRRIEFFKRFVSEIDKIINQENPENIIL